MTREQKIQYQTIEIQKYEKKGKSKCWKVSVYFHKGAGWAATKFKKGVQEGNQCLSIFFSIFIGYIIAINR